MKLESITFLQLEVTDPERSGRWYRRVLGMRLLPPEKAGRRDLVGGQFRMRLIAGTPLRARAFRIGLHLDDRPTVRAWRKHVDASDAFPNPVVESEAYYGFTVADPDGCLVEFYTEREE
jgi:catechol 2,3-dioxygenase-like lactoylglutathione lyase family enzyme